MAPFFKPRVLLFLETLSQGTLLTLVLLGVFLGLFLPYAVVGDFSPWERVEYFRPLPWREERAFSSAFFLETLAKNLLVLLALSRFLPWVERTLLPGRLRGGWAPRLYLLLLGPITGVLATPFGLPHGGFYLLVVLPLVLGEFAVFTAAACQGSRVEGKGALTLLLLALYETWAVARLL